MNVATPIVLGAMALMLVTGAADAKSARCFTKDLGYFPCSFVATDRDGSFEIRNSDGVGFSLAIAQPGFGYGYALNRAHSIPLAGQYVRSRDDGACWNNPENRDKVCAW